MIFFSISYNFYLLVTGCTIIIITIMSYDEKVVYFIFTCKQLVGLKYSFYTCRKKLHKLVFIDIVKYPINVIGEFAKR